jgi:hypothetical protein
MIEFGMYKGLNVLDVLNGRPVPLHVAKKFFSDSYYLHPHDSNGPIELHVSKVVDCIWQSDVHLRIKEYALKSINITMSMAQHKGFGLTGDVQFEGEQLILKYSSDLDYFFEFVFKKTDLKFPRIKSTDLNSQLYCGSIKELLLVPRTIVSDFHLFTPVFNRAEGIDIINFSNVAAVVVRERVEDVEEIYKRFLELNQSP